MDKDRFWLPCAIVDLGAGALCPFPMVGRGLCQPLTLSGQEHVDFLKQCFAHIFSSLAADTLAPLSPKNPKQVGKYKHHPNPCDRFHHAA